MPKSPKAKSPREKQTRRKPGRPKAANPAKSHRKSLNLNTMRKFAIYLLFVAVAIVIAALYGVATHQATYSTSPEYYTKFKFIQLNLADTLAAQHMTQPRSAVVIAGVKTSWVFGLIIGAVLGLIALIFPKSDAMFSSALQALGLAIAITLLAGLAAWATKTTLSTSAYNTLPAQLPAGLVDKPAFLRAASLQYCTILGSTLGLAAGMMLLLIKNSRLRRREQSA
jgi:hypothetical protein